MDVGNSVGCVRAQRSLVITTQLSATHGVSRRKDLETRKLARRLHSTSSLQPNIWRPKPV